ncbi:PGF-pre-PGF domain-containing protein [Halogranum gelatinilyticum]|uniref:PGF-pre-PGF domain-containing protein n=1 Tax=Halogranum gelatinilyticum TaxID=660521 RepID=UPI000B7EF640|nr:PGF-pre-PGF domain-containing protein [Halogranum gelatinilyticum]
MSTAHTNPGAEASSVGTVQSDAERGTSSTGPSDDEGARGNGKQTGGQQNDNAANDKQNGGADEKQGNTPSNSKQNSGADDKQGNTPSNSKQIDNAANDKQIANAADSKQNGGADGNQNSAANGNQDDNAADSRNDNTADSQQNDAGNGNQGNNAADSNRNDNAADGNQNDNAADNRNESARGNGRGSANESKRGVAADRRSETARDRSTVVATRGKSVGRPTQVDFRVDNATAGTGVTLDLRDVQRGPADESRAWDDVEPGVSVDRLNVTVTRDGGFTMNVTATDDRLDDAPAFDSGDGAEAAGYVRVNHSVPDADIERVEFTFRLERAKLAALDARPEAIALYRYHDGEWTELATRLEDETASEYVFVAVSPGLSDFTTGVKRPKFEMDRPSVSTTDAAAGDTVGVDVLIHNVGGADGPFHAKLVSNGAVVDERVVTVAADGSRSVRFARTLDRTGEYELHVNDVLAGTVSVDAASGRAVTGETTQAAGERETGAAETDGPGITETAAPGVGFGLGAVAVLGTLLAIRVKRR